MDVAAKEAFQEVHQRTLKIGETHAFVHEQPFDLIEHWAMRGIGINAVDTARGDDSHRRLGAFHDAHLDGRGVCAQNYAG